LLASLPAPVPARIALRGNGGRFELDLSDFVQAQTFLTRRYDPELVAFIGSRLHAGAVAFDVGAHIGLVAVQLALAKPKATIHAFEPSPENAAALHRNIVLNRLANVLVCPVAVSERAGIARLAIRSEGSNWHRIGEGGAGIDVAAVTLDEYADEQRIERVDVLKLDVEGHEPSVVKGARSLLLSGRVGAIILEENDAFDSSDGVSELLAGLGYRRGKLPRLGLHRVRTGPRNRYRNVVYERYGRAPT
jgi:FkbM family methyltransferase